VELVKPDFTCLSEEEIQMFHTFKSVLEEKEKEGKVLFLFRGEQLPNIERRLAKPANKVSVSEIFGRVFVVGEKARQYAEGVIGEKTYLSTINDVSELTLGFIFDRIKSVLSSSKLKAKIESRLPITFKTYFSDINNKATFINIISRLGFEQKLRLRDYYLYLLHTAGNDGVNKETFFVSTSLKKRIASNFSWNNKGEKRLIFHYFLPYPFDVHAIAPWMIENQHQLVIDLGLPTYSPKGLFPEQKEVSVKGALFPIFIIGVELVTDRLFVVNPNILNLPREVIPFSSFLGIPPSKTSFEATVFETAYSGSVTTYRDGSFEDERFIK